MSLQIVRAIAASENSDEFHLGRILLLLLSAAGTNVATTKPVAGITKLAKLDFLLRYPVCLERALTAVNKKPEMANVRPFERTTIESKMIRFKYGPWDDRYRRWIGILAAKGLVHIELEGKTVNIYLTELGRDVAGQFADDPAFSDLQERSSLIAKTFGSMGATQIKNFVYKVFPELENMKWGEDIDL